MEPVPEPVRLPLICEVRNEKTIGVCLYHCAADVGLFVRNSWPTYANDNRFIEVMRTTEGLDLNFLPRFVSAHVTSNTEPRRRSSPGCFFLITELLFQAFRRRGSCRSGSGRTSFMFHIRSNNASTVPFRTKSAPFFLCYVKNSSGSEYRTNGRSNCARKIVRRGRSVIV